MSEHERRVLAEMARGLAAEDPELASALRAWSESAQDAVANSVEKRPRTAQRWADTVRGWQRFPGRVAVAGGVLMVAGLLVASHPSDDGLVPPGEAEVAIFTEQIPAPGPVLFRLQGP